MPEVSLIDVFTISGTGGNPVPAVLDAGGMTALEMKTLAADFGHESVFVQPSEAADADFRYRFFVPHHEMEMCGHATLGASWLLQRNGKFDGRRLRIDTMSGIVDVVRRNGEIEVSQPAGRVENIAPGSDGFQALLEVLGITANDLAANPIQNAATSRVKTLVPIADVDGLNRVEPCFDRVQGVCDMLGSTGLYPYTVVSQADGRYEARQFPRSSGYPEDAATGIAAAALAFGLWDNGLVSRHANHVVVTQGRAMGKPSQIKVRFELAPEGGRPVGCWLSGEVTLRTTSV